MITPITYYGGKQTMAKAIVEIIPEHKIYCEPYFGGGAVFFSKKPSKIEAINDKNKKLINFYLMLQIHSKELQLMIKNSPHSEFLFDRARDIYNDRVKASKLEHAWAVWYMSHNSFNGSFHGGWKWCNGTSGTNTAEVLCKKRNEFSDELFERIKTVQISCRDALRVILDRDSDQTFFYLDPPYPGAYQGHYRGYRMTELYDLLQLLSAIKGKFLLSNYWSQTLRFFIAKNNWVFKSIDIHLGTNVNTNRIRKNTRVKTRKTEIIVANFNPWNNKQLTFFNDL